MKNEPKNVWEALADVFVARREQGKRHRPMPVYSVSATIDYRRPDGTIGCCVSSEEAAERTVAYYSEKGYAVMVRRDALCASCDGTGQRANKRNRFARVHCEACRGIGSWSLPSRTDADIAEDPRS